MDEMFGGDIGTDEAFRHIKSIGYEIETGDLVKFTKLDKELEDDITGLTFQTLLNTDSASQDITILLNYNTQTKLIQEQYENRKDELVAIESGPNTTFYITNDVAETALQKKLDKLCSNEYDKEDQFRYVAEDGDMYAIEFDYKDDEVPCSVFSDVEWVSTHFKPTQNANVILHTFTNTIKTLLSHLNDLEKIKGELYFIPPDADDEEGTELAVGKYNLYHLPNTTLYYMKTNRGELDTIFATIQMTFSAHISKAFLLMRQLNEDKQGSYECLTEQCAKRLLVIDNIEKCVKELVKSYNDQPTVYKISSEKDKKTRQSIFNYIALILYKLYIYYNGFLQLKDKYKDKPKTDYYLKKMLTFNVRHSNYYLYLELKKCFTRLFAEEFAGLTEAEINAQVITIIKEIFLQPTILFTYLLEKREYVQSRAFNIATKLKQTNTNYGAPEYSLLSYFDFFENPVNNSKNRNREDEIATHDWLEYKNIDTFSARMDIEDDVILIEFRGFPQQMKNYISSVLDAESRRQMEKQTNSNLGRISMDSLAKFIKIYDSTKKPTKAVTRRKVIPGVKRPVKKSNSKTSKNTKNLQ